MRALRANCSGTLTRRSPSLMCVPPAFEGSRSIAQRVERRQIERGRSAFDERGDDLRGDRGEQDAVAEVAGGDDLAIPALPDQRQSVFGRRPKTCPVIEEVRLPVAVLAGHLEQTCATLFGRRRVEAGIF